MIREPARPAHPHDTVVAMVLGVAGLVPLMVPAVAPPLVRHSEIYKEPGETLPEPGPSSETPGRGRPAHDSIVKPMRSALAAWGAGVSRVRRPAVRVRVLPRRALPSCLPLHAAVVEINRPVDGLKAQEPSYRRLVG